MVAKDLQKVTRPLRFSLANMSPLFLGFTVFCWALLIVFGLLGLSVPGAGSLGLVALFMLAIYGWVWFYWRPSGFEVTESHLIIHFPWRTRVIARSQISSCSIVSSEALRARFGRTYRVGAGGLWGGFGWLVSGKREWIEFYISRQKDYLLVERKDDIPLLITPSESQAMLAALL